VADRDRRHSDHAAAGATKLKPGSATRPFFGVVPEIVDADGKVLEGETSAISASPNPGRGRCARSMATTPASSRPISRPTRASTFTGDGCRRDADGYYWITGRVDDVINVSGHRMGTAEVESSLVAHAKVSEAAVVGYPHDIKGQGIYAYVTPDGRHRADRGVAEELVAWVRKDIGPIASPDQIQFAPGLPKPAPARSCAASCARSPRTNRQPRRHLDAGRSAVVDDLVENRQNKKARRRKPREPRPAGASANPAQLAARSAHAFVSGNT
jgi:acetyl-CoA synthetase